MRKKRENQEPENRDDRFDSPNLHEEGEGPKRPSKQRKRTPHVSVILDVGAREAMAYLLQEFRRATGMSWTKSDVIRWSMVEAARYRRDAKGRA